jgi:hypothetical protein
LSIDGTETLDATKSAQRDILRNVFGVVCIAGEPLRETIGFGHVRQKDFIERCAIILVLHSWDRRLLLARQTIWTIHRSFNTTSLSSVRRKSDRPTDKGIVMFGTLGLDDLRSFDDDFSDHMRMQATGIANSISQGIRPTHPMAERLSFCLIDFRSFILPEQRLHRPRCSSQASESGTAAAVNAAPICTSPSPENAHSRSARTLPRYRP